MRIVATQERVLKVFTITGLDRVFELLGSVGDLPEPGGLSA
jgi:anti-anti-sigma regulatory factor